MSNNIKRKIPMAGALLLAFSGMLISCTKSVPYKETFKEHVEAKSELSADDEYLFVASSDLTNHDDTGLSSASPYWQGEEKIVKFRFTEKSLQVVQVDEESRLKDNQLNEKVIMEIPVEHVQYRCAQDRYGKCTNQEEKNGEINWSKKGNFIPDFDGVKTTGISLLPIEMEKVYGGSCFSETSSRFLNYEMKDGSLNFQVEKVFRGDLACLGNSAMNIQSLDELQTQIIYHYSFTKLNKMSTSTYKAVNYPSADENVFGFFTTENRKYDVDLTRTEKNKIQYMNRWSPDKKEIVYYMTDNFDKPQYASIKKATQVAFDRVNTGLQAAGLDMRLVIKDPAHKQPGDVRNSMIVMVEDPVAAGPLGYGPTVANPRTGEIMSGRVAMYYGNFVQNIRYSYDEVVREMNQEAAAKAAGTVENAAAAEQAAIDSGTSKSAVSVSAELQYKTKIAEYAKNMLSNKVATQIANKYSATKATNVTSKSLAQPAAGINVRSLSRKQADKMMQQTDRQNMGIDALAAMSKYCNYPAELFPFNEYVKGALQDKLGQQLKPWAQLSDAEKQSIIDILMPELWVPTLIHELGHNLGLRHNFGGSQDKDNFYSTEELHKMGVSHEIPYSSVMDYGYSELNLLPTLGKYDIAALRFAYKREVTAKDGQTVQVKTTLKDLEAAKVELKDFKYCSDEHVEVNPDCKRFDKGTTYTEIVDYMIKYYNDMYSLRNFRNGRESFSKMNAGGYYGGMKSRFAYLRAFMERYESIKYRFSLADDAKEWTEVPWLKDLKAAALKSGQFFVDVLKTPDVICAVGETSKPNELASVIPLSAISEDAMSCFDIKLKTGYVMLGQAGRFFNDRKDPNSENNYADQIDVRGIGIDKIAAAEALFKRKTGNWTYDKNEDNYTDIPELTESITATVAATIFNQMVEPTTFKDANGMDVTFINRTVDKAGKVTSAKAVKQINMAYNIFSTPASMKSAAPTHWFETPISADIAKRIGLPMQQVSFQQILLNIVNNSMSGSQSHWKEGQNYLDQFKVTKTSKAYQLSQDSSNVLDVGGLRLVALTENAVATNAMTAIEITKRLDKLSKDDVAKLLAEKTASAGGKVTAQSAFGAEYAAIDANSIQLYQAGGLPDKDVMEYLLTILPAAN